MPSKVGRLVLALGTVVFFHSAYSTYEHLSLQKALDRPQGELPLDIAVETLSSLLIILLGVALTAAPLKEITWASEMRKRSIDQIDARPSFMTFNHRGQVLFSEDE